MIGLGILYAFIMIGVGYLISVLLKNIPKETTKGKIVVSTPPSRSELELLIIMRNLIRVICLDGRIPYGLCHAAYILFRTGAINYNEKQLLDLTIEKHCGERCYESFYWPAHEFKPRDKALTEWIKDLKKEGK